jgi:hypothetical protein
LNGHIFRAAADVYDGGTRLGDSLGGEVDLSVGFLLNDVISFQGGYSQVWSTSTLTFVQGVANPSGVQNWAYVMMLVRPGMKNRFVGLIF